MFGTIEAGGTKFNLGLGDSRGKILKSIQIPTKSPQETLKEISLFFQHEQVESFGIGLFGPVDIDPRSRHYGHFLNTPKKAWAGFDFYGAMKKIAPQASIQLETDVNLAALGEYYLGNGQDVSSLLYITIGTGIGGGFVKDGHCHYGLGHPEMGHLLVRPHPDDPFQGTCPYHKSCLEGMAAGPSIQARYGLKGQELKEDHPIWTYLSSYIGQGLLAYTCILRPATICLGGGVMKTPGLIDRVRASFQKDFGHYLHLPPLDLYIREPGLKDQAGLVGGLVLAMDPESRQKLRK